MQDPWHNWHKPEDASEMEFCCYGTVAGPTTPPESHGVMVATEPHHADLMSLEAPSREGAVVIVE